MCAAKRLGFGLKNKDMPLLYNNGYLRGKDGVFLFKSEWDLLLEFQTNSPNTTTFDPVISAISGEYKWDLGDGTVVEGTTVSHTYADATTKTVKLYGKNTPIITSINMESDNIVGNVDLSDITFSDNAQILFSFNYSLTGLQLPIQISDVTVKGISVYQNGITDTLDLSYVQKLASSASIQVSYGTAMTGLILPSSLSTGSLYQLGINSNPNLESEIDVSAFNNFAANSSIRVQSCPKVTTLTTATSTSGLLYEFTVTNTGITSIDLTYYNTWNATNARLYINSNPDLDTLLFPSSVTGKFSGIQLHANPSLSGDLDLSPFTSIGGSIQAHSNTTMTGITFASSMAAGSKLTYLTAYNSNVTGDLDLTMWGDFGTSFYLDIYNNSLLTGIDFPSSFTGTLFRIDANSCDLTGDFDLTMWGTYYEGFSIYLNDNPNLTDVSFNSSVTGRLNNLEISSTGLSGVFDLSMFSTFSVTGGNIFLNNNSALTGVTLYPSAITGYISKLYLHTNIFLGYVDLTILDTGISYLSYQFTDNGWGAALVDRILYELDGISSSGGYTNRSILIAGTNAAPTDGSSTGYDGLTAKSSLQSKGFTVTTN